MIKGDIVMNQYQTEFSQYWDKISNTAFYKVVKITENPHFKDLILDSQREKLSDCVRNEIERTFFDSQLRPESTVWMENLKKAYPDEGNRLEEAMKACQISSKGYENILTIAAGGTAAVAGVVIGKRSPLLSALMILGGVAAAGYKLASGLSVDTQTLQKEVRKQFDQWKLSLLNILSTCDDAESAQAADE